MRNTKVQTPSTTSSFQGFSTVLGAARRSFFGCGAPPVVRAMPLWRVRHHWVLTTPLGARIASKVCSASWWCVQRCPRACCTSMVSTAQPWCEQHLSGALCNGWCVLHRPLQLVSHYQWCRLTAALCSDSKNYNHKKGTFQRNKTKAMIY